MSGVKGQIFNQYILCFVAEFAIFLQENIFKDMLLYMIMMSTFTCVIAIMQVEDHIQSKKGTYLVLNLTNA